MAHVHLLQRRANRRGRQQEVNVDHGTDDVLVYEIDKNAGSKVRARLYTFNGHRLADLRLFVTRKAGELVPTRWGITVRTSQLPKLAEAVETLGEEVEREQAAASESRSH